MARGAKFMKVHNLPGWYNTNGNLFGQVKAPRAVRAYTPKVLPNIPKIIKNIPKIPWTVARQSSIRMFNKTNLKNVLRGAIGPNSSGKGWAKYKNDYYPLLGTARPSGYVINLSKRNAPVNYNIVVKGLKPYGSAARPIPRLKF